MLCEECGHRTGNKATRMVYKSWENKKVLMGGVIRIILRMEPKTKRFLCGWCTHFAQQDERDVNVRVIAHGSPGKYPVQYNENNIKNCRKIIESLKSL